MPKGRVVRVDSGSCIVREEHGDEQRCLIPGIMKRDDVGLTNPVAVGDFITFEEMPAGDAIVREVHERHGILSRSNPEYSNNEQVIVSNVDQIMLVSSVREPKLRAPFLDRVLVAAEYARLKAIIVINKMDMDKKKSRVAEIAEIYRGIGYPVILTSAVRNQGLEEVKDHLRDKTTVITGQSGVGKTSLLNLIEPDLELPVGDVSRKTKRGTHTTTWAELFPLSFGGWIADTPGMRSFSLWDIPSHAVDSFFVEIRPLISHCRFGAKCNHINEPDCAVLKAVEEGRISRLRYDGFRKICETISEEEDDMW